MFIEGGFTYHIHFSHAPVKYYVNRVRTTQYTGKPHLNAPWGAVECLPGQDSSDADVLLCHFSETEIH
jgi:hypothetical protein